MGLEKLWIVTIVCLIGCAIGFKKFVWFMSIGYGLAIALAGVCLAIMFNSSLSFVTILQCLVFVAYGCRLAGFLYKREIKSSSYNKAMEGVSDKKMPIFVLIFMWLFMGVYYTLQVSPVFYRLYNGSSDVALPLIGVIISVIGIIIEALSDIQKSKQKAINPNFVATEGLFKICRCPNYFGELLMWLGVLIGGISTYKNLGQWLMAIIAFVLICFIMFDGAKRLETRQNKRYGDDPKFKEYCAKTPIIIPLIPIYHLAKEEKK